MVVLRTRDDDRRKRRRTTGRKTNSHTGPKTIDVTPKIVFVQSSRVPFFGWEAKRRRRGLSGSLPPSYPLYRSSLALVVRPICERGRGSGLGSIGVTGLGQVNATSIP
jgi:hypothetical protein